MSNYYLDKLKQAIKGRVILYIDAANLEQSVRDMWVNPKDIPDHLKDKITNELHYHIDYKKFKILFSLLCNLQELKFYTPDFNTSSHHNFFYFMKKLGFKISTKPLKEYGDHTIEKPHRKANFDVEIAVDTIINIDNFDTIILFSGDCDFEYLVKILRGRGKIVIVFSRQGHVAKELPPASSYYFDIVDFRNEIMKIDLKQ